MILSWFNRTLGIRYYNNELPLTHVVAQFSLTLFAHWISSSILAGKQRHYMTQGLWVIVGLLAFLLLEKMFPDQGSQEDPPPEADLNFNSAVSISAALIK